MFDKEFSGKSRWSPGPAAGIGRAVALRLAEHDAVVAAMDRDTKALQALADEARTIGAIRQTSPPAPLSRPLSSRLRTLRPRRPLVNAAGILG